MRWFANFIKEMHKTNRKSMAKVGKSGNVYLLAYPDKIVGSDGLVTITEYTKVEIRAVIVPFASQGFGRRFAEQLDRHFKGESLYGFSYLIVDDKWLYDNSIEIDTELDKIEWDNNQYKFTRRAPFEHYFNTSIYLIERLAETYEE